MKHKNFKSVKLSFLFLTLLTACVQFNKSVPEKKKGKSENIINRTKSPNNFEVIPPLPKKGYFLKLLADRLYYFSTGNADTIFAVTPEGTLLIDPIKDASKTLQHAMLEIKAPPIKMLIYSHSNLNRIGATTLFAQKSLIIAHRRTAELIRNSSFSNVSTPSISFNKDYYLDFGGLQIYLKYPESGKNGKTIIYFPKQKLLMYLGAVPKTAPPKNFDTFDIIRQAKILKEILKYDFKNYISGSYHRPGDKKEMKEILNYFFATKSASKDAIKAKASKENKGKQPSHNRKKTITEHCLRLLEPHWRKKLKGFETSAQNYCHIWTDFHLRTYYKKNKKVTYR